MIQSQVGKCLDGNLKYLDLSKSGIVALGKLNGSQNVQVLNLSQNYLPDVMNIGIFSNLWKLDLSNNKMRSLSGLVNFIVLGALNLSYNQLSWPELLKLRHIHILDLTLHGNPQLVKDTYYQIHVIDCLPNCWMLDGKLITSGDHFRVGQFFKKSENQRQPVRHKLPKTSFFPSYLKKIQVFGTFGPRAAHVLTTFPLNIPANIDVDKKHLEYLAFNMQEIIAVEKPNCDIIKNHNNFLEQLFEQRVKNREQSNVLFLLLLASLEFSIPSQTIVEMLSVTNLQKCGDIFTIDLFLMPRELRGITVGLLFNAIKLDREENVDAGVYKQLFLHLCSNVPELLKFTSSKIKQYEMPKTQCYKDYRFLLAAEVSQVLMIVPSFYYYLQLQEPGLFCVLIEATNLKEIHEIINKMLEDEIRHQPKSCNEISEGDQKENPGYGTVVGSWQRELSEMLSVMIQKHLKEVTSKDPKLTSCEEILYLNPFKKNVSKTRYVIQQTLKIPDRNVSAQSTTKKHIPRIGENVILGKQVFGKIIALPSKYTAKVYIDGVLEPNGSIIKRVKESWKHYKIINLNNMDWDGYGRCWRWKMPREECQEMVSMDPLSTLEIKASQSQEKKEMWSTPVKSMSAKAASCRSLSYITQPDLKEKSYYLQCNSTSQEEQGEDSDHLESELNFDKPDVKVIMNMDNVSDSVEKEDLKMTDSDFENYVRALKSSSAKREHPDSEVLVLHLEKSKRPHSAIPIIQMSKTDLEKEGQPDRYPLLATRKNMFSKVIRKSPVSTQWSSRNSSTDVDSGHCLSGGDASCREEKHESAATASADVFHSMQKKAEEKKREAAKAAYINERSKSSSSCPMELKNPIQVVSSNNWLANGRDLFKERKQQQYLKRFTDLPSWKEKMNSLQKPEKSLKIKGQCPTTAFRITRPKSETSTSNIHEENETAKMPQVNGIKESLSNLLSPATRNYLKTMKKDKGSPNQEDEKDQIKLKYSLESLVNENIRLEFLKPYLKHPPSTPISSCNFLWK